MAAKTLQYYAQEWLESGYNKKEEMEVLLATVFLNNATLWNVLQ